MSFLAPLAFGLAAIVVPTLLILYFLKLRRRQELVPSTLLWRRAVQDLQVNAPFQKLRKNLLLFLQLLILAAAVTALARPIIETDIANQASVVLLVDRSASMNTLEDGRTRFEIATEQAIKRIKTLNRSSRKWWSLFGERAQTRMMVIAYAERASVIAPFTTNNADAIAAIQALEPTDGETNLREALELAEAYMMQTRIEQTAESAAQASEIVLFSDGDVGALDDVVLRGGDLRFVQIGETPDNAGITSLRVQRNYERPELLSTFLQVQNFGPAPVTTDVSFFVDGMLRSVQTVALAPLRRRDAEGTAPTDVDDPDRAQGSARSLVYEIELNRGAVVETRLSRDDALPVDNRAFAVVPAPRRMRVLLVTKGNIFLETALQHLPLESLRKLSPEAYETAPASEIEEDGHSLYDAVVFDKHATERLPAGNYIFFGALPAMAGLEQTGEVDSQVLQWWDETHPILRHVTLDYVYAAKCITVSTPPDIEKLVEGSYGPVLFRYSKDARHVLVLTFAVEQSTWWSKASFPVFMYNALRYMGSGGALAEHEPLHPGAALRIQLPAGVETAELIRPDGVRTRIRADGRGVARYAGTQRVGVYRVENGIEGRDRYAVNLESASESDIAPRKIVTLGAGVTVKTGEVIEAATPEVWRWFVGAALLLVLLEWYIYNRRVMI